MRHQAGRPVFVPDARSGSTQPQAFDGRNHIALIPVSPIQSAIPCSASYVAQKGHGDGRGDGRGNVSHQASACRGIRHSKANVRSDAPLESRFTLGQLDASTQALIPEGLAKLEQRRLNPTGRDTAYAAFLDALVAWGLLDRLPVDHRGVLRVNAPFCGAFSEVPLLLPFLSRRFVGEGRAAGLEVYGCDLEPQGVIWATMTEWARRAHDSKVRLQLEQCDLQAQGLPPAGLVIAIHPGPYINPVDPGPWLQIISNVLRSCICGGRCIFACFFVEEAEAVKMICERLGVHAEVAESPYYQVDPLPLYTDYRGVAATPLRYAVVIRRGVV